MARKLKAIEITLSDGEKIFVHEPSAKNLGIFLKALPALTALGKAAESIQSAMSGVVGIPVDISDSVMDGISPLFAIMSDITIEEYEALSVWDSLAILSAFGEFAPNQKPAASADSAN